VQHISTLNCAIELSGTPASPFFVGEDIPGQPKDFRRGPPASLSGFGFEGWFSDDGLREGAIEFSLETTLEATGEVDVLLLALPASDVSAAQKALLFWLPRRCIQASTFTIDDFLLEAGDWTGGSEVALELWTTCTENFLTLDSPSVAFPSSALLLSAISPPAYPSLPPPPAKRSPVRPEGPNNHRVPRAWTADLQRRSTCKHTVSAQS
jgi:hypothetical protein